MASLARTESGRAHFVERKTIAALTTPLISQGTLAFRKPAHLEKMTDSPYEKLTVDGGRMVIDNGHDAPRVLELGSQPEIGTLVDTILGALSGNLALLRRSYDVSGRGTPADWTITLVPRNPAIARLVRTVRLAGGNALRSLETVTPDGDADTLTITADPQ